MSWARLAAAAPDLAREGWARFGRTKVALLGTIREDGSPRISPVEPFLVDRALVIGVMRSPKLHDLRRDPRCELHSSVSRIDGSEGEFKVRGRAIATAEPGILGHPDAWWSGRPPDRFGVFAIEVEEAVLVTWSLPQDRMTTARWTPQGGLRETSRSYP